MFRIALRVHWPVINYRFSNHTGPNFSNTTMASSGMLLEPFLIEKMQQSVPPLTHDSHKGESGRIGVFGGSLEYTGAPYFASISALRAGCDLVHVFCRKEAAPVIKSYSPELIVHPLLDATNAVETIGEWLSRIHCAVVGPGLGRDDCVFKILPTVLQLIKEKDIPLVIDADGLFYINNNFIDIQGWKKVILTPNAMEFVRLYKAVTGNAIDMSGSNDPENVRNLAAKLGNVTIFCKGKSDLISNGIHTVVCKDSGSPRRCGGQGDLLSGVLATFLYWSTSDKRAEYPTLAAACTASYLIKAVSRQTFEIHKRGMLATDMIPFIAPTFHELLERT